MKTFAVFYYEGRREVCWTIKAATKEDADIEFRWALANGEIERFNDKKAYTISECH